ncbi:hypothetical protein [uncultured Bradyrhizobium sp.]|uniref:hypothetical protein n=1 Tax=uncultured Bradyrhizobium sp. TaxID=199684 RepID=UPI0035CA2328
MQRLQSSAVVMVTSLILGGAARAQQPAIQWKQTINVPKGLNLPRDTKVDILGIELGDTYDEVKAKLERLLAESTPPKPKEPPVTQAAPKAPQSSAGSSLIAPSINIAQMDAHRLGTMADKEMQVQGQLSGASGAPPLNESKVEMYLQINSERIVVSYVDGFALARDLNARPAKAGK